MICNKKPNGGVLVQESDSLKFSCIQLQLFVISPNTAQQSRPFVAKSDGTHCQVNSSNAFHVGQLCLPLPSILARRIHSLFPSILGKPHTQKCIPKKKKNKSVRFHVDIFKPFKIYKHSNFPKIPFTLIFMIFMSIKASSDMK